MAHVLRELDRCIFCGGDDMTEEHILADWAHRAWHRSRKTADKSFAARNVPGGIQFVKSEPIGVAKVICRQCNNGWLSAIDNAASRAIKPLVRQEPFVTLDREQQTAVATWLYKCALIVDASAGERRHGLSHLREGFMRHRTPSPCTIVVGPADAPPSMEVGSPPKTVYLWRLGALPKDGTFTLRIVNEDGSPTDTEPSPIPIPGYQIMVGAFWAFVWFQMPTVRGLDKFEVVWPPRETPVTVRALSMNRQAA